MSDYYTKRITVKRHTQRYWTKDSKGKKQPITKQVDPYPRMQRYRDYKTISREEAIRRFNQKSIRARAIDISKTSKKLLDDPNEYWLRNMGRSDVKRIDTKEVKKTEEEIKKVEEEINLLSLALLGTSDPKKESPGIYADLQKAKAKLERLKLEAKMSTEQLKKLKIPETKKVEWKKEWEKAKKIQKEYEKATKIKKISPTDTKEIIFSGKKLTVLASTFEEEFNPITEKNKNEMDKWLKEHPKAKITDYNFRNYHPYIQDKIIKKRKSEVEKLQKKYDKIKKIEAKIKTHTLAIEQASELAREYPGEKAHWSKRAEEHLKRLNYYKKMLEYYKKDSKEIKKTKTNSSKSILPKLTGDKKYIMAYVTKEGYARYIGYTKNPEKAIKDLNAERKISKKLGIKNKIELFVANDIEDVRDQIHARGREDYLITGNTYPNRKKIHSIAKVKFDYEKKGFRGKISKEELEKLKKIPDLKFEKSKPITKEEKELSATAKAHSKSKKWLKHERKAGSIWQKEKPFTKEQVYTWNSLTHFPQDWNKEFKNSVNKKEQAILKRLKIQKIEDAPEDVQNAFDHYCKNVYNYIIEYNRAKQIAPPVSVVGPAKYPTHKIPKADAVRKRASEKLEKSKKTVDKITTQYVRLNPKKSAEEIRQEYRIKITPKLIKAQKEGKKVYSQLHGRWYDIERVNKKTITVKAQTGDYTFTIDKHFIDQIEI